MKETRIATRYAKALFDLSLEFKILDKVKNDMEVLISVCKQNKDFRLLMNSPIVNVEKKEVIIKEIFEKSFQTMSLNFLIIIIRKRREANIELIAEKYIVLYKEYKHITTTNLKTTVEINKEIRKEIIDLMKKQTKGEIELIENIDKNLIGGFILDFDDMQYDASISKEIKNLKKEFAKNLYKKGF
ncbi:MAG: ATP synthase F1 subunit delta [Bacteroidales bacterium]|nr:ATP synthase F1 subunit delta [Bacteroidales bacterium]